VGRAKTVVTNRL